MPAADERYDREIVNKSLLNVSGGGPYTKIFCTFSSFRRRDSSDRALSKKER